MINPQIDLLSFALFPADDDGATQHITNDPFYVFMLFIVLLDKHVLVSFGPENTKFFFARIATKSSKTIRFVYS